MRRDAGHSPHPGQLPAEPKGEIEPAENRTEKKEGPVTALLEVPEKVMRQPDPLLDGDALEEDILLRLLAPNLLSLEEVRLPPC